MPKTKTTAEQTARLEEFYAKKTIASTKDYEDLSIKLDLPKKFIQGWFMRRRAKDRQKDMGDAEIKAELNDGATLTTTDQPKKRAKASQAASTKRRKIEKPAPKKAETPELEIIEPPAPKEPEIVVVGAAPTDDSPPAGDAEPAATHYDYSKFSAPSSVASFLFPDRVARAPFVHLAQLHNIPISQFVHRPDCPTIIQCSNDVTWYSFDPKYLPETLSLDEAPLRYLKVRVLQRYTNPPYPPIDRASLVKLVLGDDDLVQKAMGLVLLTRLGLKIM